MAEITFEVFKDYVEKFRPFRWDQELRKNWPHTAIYSLIRYYKIIHEISKLYCPGDKIIDFGFFPGNFSKMCQELMDANCNYTGVGLGFDQEMKHIFHQRGVTLIEKELDPNCFYIESAKPDENVPQNAFNLSIFTDTIEHLVNPFEGLDLVNRSLITGGHVILTTDNLTSFANSYNMILKGTSPNVPFENSFLFYRGDWRPHFREFSKDELFFIFNYCGFQIIKHEYFERFQGNYFFDANNKIKFKNHVKGIKGLIYKLIVSLFPHLRNHHLIVAKKIDSYEKIKERREKNNSINLQSYQEKLQ